MKYAIDAVEDYRTAEGHRTDYRSYIFMSLIFTIMSFIIMSFTIFKYLDLSIAAWSCGVFLLYKSIRVNQIYKEKLNIETIMIVMQS